MERYPITAAQRLHFAALERANEPQVLNICVSIQMKLELDFELLERAIRQAIERDGSARTQFTPPTALGQIYQYISSGEDIVIRSADLSDKSESEAMHILRDWSAQPFDPRWDAPLCEFAMLKMPGGYAGAYIRIDHMINDSCAMIVLMCDIIELYSHMAFGTAEPDARTDYLLALQKDIEHAADPVRTARDREFWQLHIEQNGEPLYSDVGGARRLAQYRANAKRPSARYALAEWDDLRVGQFTYILETEPAHQLLAFCEEQNISMTNFLLMGLRTYLSHQNDGQQDISVRNYVSRRVARVDRRSGGTRIHCYPCRTILPPALPFLDGVREIAKVQNQVYRHTDFDGLEVDRLRQEWYDAPPTALYESVALTYQPFPMRLKEESLNALEYISTWHTNGTAVQPLYLTVMHRPLGAGMDFYFKYQAALYSDVQVRDVYYYLMRILFRLTEKPDSTIEEVLAWI